MLYSKYNISVPNLITSIFSKLYLTAELHTSPFLTFGKEAGGLAEKPACTMLVVCSLVLLWIFDCMLINSRPIFGSMEFIWSQISKGVRGKKIIN